MSSPDPTDALAARTTRRRILATGTKLAYAAPLVAASLKISAGPAFAQVISPGGGCADLFAQRDPDTGAETPFCCPSQLVCAGATTAAGDDQCCYEDEVCFASNTPCCRSNQDGTCTVQSSCTGCCRSCGADGSGNTICCDQAEQCVTDPATGAKTCESLNTARLNRFRL